MILDREILTICQKERFPYSIKVDDGLVLDVFEEVFSPKYFDDSLFFAKSLLDVIPNSSTFLEIGVGTGIIPLILREKISKCVGVDINQNAVDNARENFKKYKMDSWRVFRGDVFDSLNSDEEFDIIFWNFPFLHFEKELSDYEKCLADKEYLGIKKFIEQAFNYTTRNGRVFFGLSISIGKLDKIMRFVIDSGLEVKILNQTFSHREKGSCDFTLFELL